MVHLIDCFKLKIIAVCALPVTHVISRNKKEEHLTIHEDPSFSSSLIQNEVFYCYSPCHHCFYCLCSNNSYYSQYYWHRCQ